MLPNANNARHTANEKSVFSCTTMLRGINMFLSGAYCAKVSFEPPRRAEAQVLTIPSRKRKGCFGISSSLYINVNMQLGYQVVSRFLSRSD